jgi:fructokinase
MTDDKHAVPVIFGEVLFDCFPDGNSVLGGAPFNVAWHLQAFGLSPVVISGIGDDELGESVKRAMQDWNMNTAGLQIDSIHPTGSVDIEFDDGEPRYTIVEHRAYDHIRAESLPATAHDGLLYHGSLALRNEVSRQALARLKADHSGTVFMDVNLRDPWWQKAFVLDLVSDADWVKLNEDELRLLGSGNGMMESQAREFMQAHALTGLVVTLGANGAVALTADGRQASAAPPQTLEVVDTVGAGDAFTSVLILGITHQWPLELTIQRAQNFAALIVGKQGATVHDPGFYRSMISDWQLDV